MNIRNNQQLINHLFNARVLRTLSLIKAFEKCDRILFVPEPLHENAYGDYPLQIGHGQTISQPYTVAMMLEMLSPNPGDKVLDIGSGSGWTTALIASAVGQNGFVEGIERIEPLVDYGQNNLKKAHIDNAAITLADPAVLGRPGHTYDRILVSASASSMPSELFEQLRPNGILVIPIGQSIWRFTKDAEEKIDAYEFPGFRFVPLILP